MKAVKVIIVANKITEKNPPLHVEVADSFFKRLCGLMGRKNMPKGKGLLLFPCNSIHMMFMRFSIDILYFDKNYQIIKLVKNLKPWWGISRCGSAYGVIESASGTIDSYGYSVGDKLIIGI